MALVSAAPACAETAGGQKQGPVLPGPRLQERPQTIVSDPASVPASPERDMFTGAKAGLGLSSQTYPQQDGSSTVATGLIGSLPLVPGVSAGLGLLSVTHENQKEPEFRRNWSAKNLGPRSRRVVAVGLNVRF
jgi:hypothetical protein